MSNFYLDCAIINSLTLPTTPASVLEQLKSDIKTKTYLKGEYIFISDQEIQAVVGINSGLAKLYFMDHFGNEFTLKILASGDIIGHRQILDNEKFNGYIQVIEDAEVCMLSKNMFLKLLDEDISINKKLIEKLCADLRLAKDIIANLSLKDVKHRICSILVKLHKQFSVPGSDDINAELSREDFAKLVGVARESLSRSLSELVLEKVIFIEKKRIKILDWARLIQLSKI
ncbi:MAG: Crp/Fnr family transcriptional regulator [Bacteroidetes bacterium]|nr:Crp/Fnr family transcriptional regulator [Bacteroidota bacterium]